MTDKERQILEGVAYLITLCAMAFAAYKMLY